ncbi:MAG: dockerin type I repeat-containing protein [Oscillospiraceae bacterium]|nr:dockerin type I repeat-containing protein [Oscillospiraceae bacterium]
MKARKAALVGLFAVSAGFSSLIFPQHGAYARAAEVSPAAAISVQSVAAERDGTFCAEVCLDELPESGLSALEFAIAYDEAALRITQAELLYDTGAQEAESRIFPGLKVFSIEQGEGLIQLRWGTALEIPDYWLREERPYVRLEGEITDALAPGTAAELRIVPPNVRLQDGTEQPDQQVTAGYLDTEGNVFRCDVSTKHGAVWRPVDETGATMYGDLDLDGQCSVSDAVLLARVIAEEGDLCAAAYANADCEADGMLTIADVTLMLQVLTHEREAAALGAR